MSLLEIISYPDPRLKVATTTVEQFDSELKTLVDNLFETMYEDRACGLAANQVGHTLSVFVMDTSRDNSNPICMINPDIIHSEGIDTSEEGCMSFPGVYAKVKRAKTVTVRFKNVKGEDQELTADKLAGFCVQHESDHLNGILFTDHMSQLKRNRLLKKLTKIQQFQA